MCRIADSDAFPLLASFVYPGKEVGDVRNLVRSFTNIRDFQHEVMFKMNEQVITRSTDGLTVSGLEKLSKDKRYLFISNHRDIVLDSSLLQYLLVKNGFETTEITFGANLMQGELVIDIGKSNKMFKVARPSGNVKDFYKASQHLSDYIRHAITEKKESVWIAQRNGRTKDGDDKTDQGIIKMFCMSHPSNKIEALAELNIVPVSVSYEWESCDILKTLELYVSKHTKYVKKPGEDLNSILMGIVQQKGRVNISVCDPITEQELRQFSDLTNNDYHRSVAQLITRRIQSAYELYPNNYIAHDMLYGNETFKNRYTEEQKADFLHHIEKLEQYEELDGEALLEILLGIYANPVRNRNGMLNSSSNL